MRALPNPCAITVLILGTCLFTVACQPVPLKIGLAAGLTGPQSQLGIDGRNAAQLAVKLFNARGGIAGHPVELLVADDGNSVDQAVSADTGLAKAGCPVIIGHYVSGMVPAIEKVLTAGNVLYLSPTISADSLTGRDDLFVRTYPSVTVQAGIVGRLIAEAGLKRTVVVYDSTNALYAQPMVSVIDRAVAASGGSLAAVLTYDPRTPGHRALADAVLAAQPDAVMMILTGFDAAQLAQQIRKLDSRPRFFGPNWPQTGELLSQGGAAVEGMVLVSLFQHSPPSPAMVDFAASYQEAYGTPPGFASYLTFEIFMVLDESLRAHPSALTPEGIKQAIIETAHFQGLQAPVSIDRFGDALKSYRVLTVRDGAYVQTGAF